MQVCHPTVGLENIPSRIVAVKSNLLRESQCLPVVSMNRELGQAFIGIDW
jgi:hypothetical protein